MPFYDYECDSCDNTFEEQLVIADRKIPVGKLCEQCGEGKIHQKIGVPLFAYDNISSPGHKKSTPSWMKDKLKDIKRNQPGATMTVPE
jgi:putative FmdB family regulatory protein